MHSELAIGDRSMSELRLRIVEREHAVFGSCGVESIDSLVKGAYAATLFKQVLAYDILVDEIVVGSCMLRFAVIRNSVLTIRSMQQ